MDREIVIRAQAGDREAFTRLAGTLTPSFLATAHRILRDISLAEDATQRAMINIWKGLPKLREPERFEAWSHRLLVRACYSEGRRTRRWEPAMGLFDPDDARTPDTTGAVVDRDELEVPLDEARLLDETLRTVGLEQDQQANLYLLEYHLDLDGDGPGTRQLTILFESILPDGTIGCTACG